MKLKGLAGLNQVHLVDREYRVVNSRLRRLLPSLAREDATEDFDDTIGSGPGYVEAQVARGTAYI